MYRKVSESNLKQKAELEKRIFVHISIIIYMEDSLEN